MSRSFLLQGHRGARGLFPENTLEGFAATIALGVDSIELDIAITRDGVPVVLHDPTLDPDITREPDGGWIGESGIRVRDLTAAEIARYDVGRLRPGSALAGRHPDQAPADGARIPTLAAVFAATPGTVLDVELKSRPDQPGMTVGPEEMAERVLACAEAEGATDRTVIRSFDWRGLRHLRRIRPALPLVWLTSPSTEAEPALWWDIAAPESTEAAIAAEAEGAPWRPVWAPEHGRLDRARLGRAQSLGLGVIPWTVNERAEMDRLIAWGADGLCTDRPDRARAAMQAAGLALPG